MAKIIKKEAHPYHYFRSSTIDISHLKDIQKEYQYRDKRNRDKRTAYSMIVNKNSWDSKYKTKSSIKGKNFILPYPNLQEMIIFRKNN